MKAIIVAILAFALLAGVYVLLTNDTQREVPAVSDTETDDTETDEMADMDMRTDQESETTEENDDVTISVDEEVDVEVSGEASVDTGGQVREFTIDSFSFGYSMEEIRVNEGDTVTINLTNSGGFHDLVIDEFDAATAQIQAGGTTSVTFVASAAGTYEYYCSVGNHRAQGMVGTLIVE